MTKRRRADGALYSINNPRTLFQTDTRYDKAPPGRRTPRLALEDNLGDRVFAGV